MLTLIMPEGVQHVVLGQVVDLFHSYFVNFYLGMKTFGEENCFEESIGGKLRSINVAVLNKKKSPLLKWGPFQRSKSRRNISRHKLTSPGSSTCP